MPYSFFDRATTEHPRTSPAVISLKERGDVAASLYYANLILADDPSVKAAFTRKGLPAALDVSSPQKITAWLYLVTNRLKEIALETDIEPLTTPELWFFEALTKALELQLNIAQTKGNKRLPLKKDSTSDASIIIHRQPHQTIYSVPAEFGAYFDFLNTRASHPTDSLLDKACKEREKKQVTRFREENDHLIRLAASSNLDFRNMTTEELEKAFIETRSKIPSQSYPSQPYGSYREGLIMFLTYATVFAEREQLRNVHIGQETPSDSMRFGA